MINHVAIYHNVLLILVLLFPFMVVPTTQNWKVVDVPRSYWGYLFIVFAAYCFADQYIGLGTWTDRGAYAGTFLEIQQNGYQFEGFRGETLFRLYTWFVSCFTDYRGWFWVTAILYVLNYFMAARRMTREYAFVLFLSMLCCFQFAGYGYNTIRAGFAGSLVILGLSNCDRPKLMLGIFFFALFCHNSMAIPIGSLALAYKFPNKTKWFILLWLSAILISLLAGSAFESFFSRFVDDRRQSYFGVKAAQTIYKVGFRWDFLLYSTLPVILGYWYLFKLGFQSVFYRWIYNTYLVANAFWILVIRAEYTDRFAYLSWFMFPILLMYPLLSQQLFREASDQKKAIVMTLWGQFAFTYYMFFTYNGMKMF